MREPSIFHYIVLVICCLGFAIIGLYFLTNFSRLFRGTVKNEWLRKNIVAWLVIFFLSCAITPISGGFYYVLNKYGWVGTVLMQIGVTTLYTLISFNFCRYVAEEPILKKLSFVKHKLLILLTLVVSTMLINTAVIYFLYHKDKDYMLYFKYSLISNLYISATIGLVYGVISYLDIERKRKFDEKELELSRLQELKAKAELEALHSKVNPHFLYNALNSIADLSITDGKKARRMTIALADLFRYSINYSNNNYSTLRDEVAMTEVYLQIEKIRFEDQLNYTISIAPGVEHYLVPRFLLQPVVENAVKHGLKATGRMTQIDLEVKQEGDGLEIIVADNGPAFPAEIIPGYGVKSVFDKLDLLFPGQYSIHFRNEPRKHIAIYISKLMKNEPAV